MLDNMKKLKKKTLWKRGERNQIYLERTPRRCFGRKMKGLKVEEA